jgi:MFS superfamily sulfate permease-like transporter
MRIRTALIFLFIFVTWWTIYQAIYSYMITIVFITSIAAIIWLMQSFKRFKQSFKSKPRVKRLYLRSTR